MKNKKLLAVLPVMTLLISTVAGCESGSKKKASQRQRQLQRLQVRRLH